MFRRHTTPQLTKDERNQATDEFAAKNALTIKEIPDRFITTEERNGYIARALAGEDVYGYRSANPTEETWNIWDIDTRIVLPPVEKVWTITSIQSLPNERWHVVVQRGGQEVEFTLWIHHHPQYDAKGEATYLARAPRRIKDIVNHCGAFDSDPANLQGCHQ